LENLEGRNGRGLCERVTLIERKKKDHFEKVRISTGVGKAKFETNTASRRQLV